MYSISNKLTRIHDVYASCMYAQARRRPNRKCGRKKRKIYPIPISKQNRRNGKLLNIAFLRVYCVLCHSHTSVLFECTECHKYHSNGLVAFFIIHRLQVEVCFWYRIKITPCTMRKCVRDRWSEYVKQNTHRTTVYTWKTKCILYTLLWKWWNKICVRVKLLCTAKIYVIV